MEKTISKPRKCPKCNQHKEGDGFYNSVSFYCIPCANEFQRDRRKKISNKEIYIIKKVKNNEWYRYLDSNGVKYCNKCENVKPKEEFPNDKDSTISGKKSNCKKCLKWERYRKIDQKHEENIKKAQESEWYKNYMKSKTKKPSANAKKQHNLCINKLKMAKRVKFRNLPQYQ